MEIGYVAVFMGNWENKQLRMHWDMVILFSVWVQICHPGAQANSAFHPSGVGKWGPASAGKELAGMVIPLADERGVCR